MVVFKANTRGNRPEGWREDDEVVMVAFEDVIVGKKADG